MKSAMALLAALLAAAAAAVSAEVRAAVAETPVSKVVKLLQDIQASLEKEAQDDQTVYEKAKSDIEVSIKQKAKAIEEANSRLVSLDTEVQGAAASAARLGEEITGLTADAAKSQESLDTATTLREKQATESKAKESELLAVLKALDAAIDVLSKGRVAKGAAFLDASHPEDLLKEVNRQIEKHSDVLVGAITPSQKRLIASLSQAPDFKQEYTPRSGEILKILRDMKATFEASLKQGQDDEAKHAADYDALKTAKTSEIAATLAAVDQKKVQLAEAGATKARAEQDIKDTKKSVETDADLVADYQQKSNGTDSDYAVRSKVRSDEVAAVVQAISILTSDQAKSAFDKTFKPASLLQLIQPHKKDSSARDAAVALLDTMAQKTADKRLSALVDAARADALKEVKDAINKLIVELLAEGEDEVKLKDSCVARTDKNSADVQTYQTSKSDLDVRAKTLASSIAELAGVVKTIEAEIANAQDQLTKADEDRKLQHQDYQKTIADHQETQRLLQQAIAVLKTVYASEAPVAAAPAAALLQTSTVLGAEQAPASSTSTAGAAVVALLEQILADAKAMEKEALQFDQAADAAYAAEKAQTEASIAAKQSSIVDKNEAKAKVEQELLSAQSDTRATEDQLKLLDSETKALTTECDALVKNFDARKEARSQEVEALRQALSILSAVKAEVA